MSTKFDSKIFNAEAFGKYYNTIPDATKTELLKSGAITGSKDISDLFTNQVNSYYGVIPFYGLLDGEPDNYDGQTDIVASSTKTYERGVVAFGRAKAWEEKDFSYDVTSGVDFMSNVARQVKSYWGKVDQNTLLLILNAIFSMNSNAKEKEFVTEHTYEVGGKIREDSLNTATQRACGDNKNSFGLVFMHSLVATQLENLNIMTRLKYTDANGIERELTLGQWGGRLVVMDDSAPVNGDKYTTYVLGDKSIEFEDLGVKVPFEMDRDPARAGGVDLLYTRKRLCIAPYGISYTKKKQASLSPTGVELGSGENWTLVNDGAGDFISHKTIPIARIISTLDDPIPIPEG